MWDNSIDANERELFIGVITQGKEAKQEFRVDVFTTDGKKRLGSFNQLTPIKYHLGDIVTCQFDSEDKTGVVEMPLFTGSESINQVIEIRDFYESEVSELLTVGASQFDLAVTRPAYIASRINFKISKAKENGAIKMGEAEGVAKEKQRVRVQSKNTDENQLSLSETDSFYYMDALPLWK